jgi:hypothetical protein
MARAVEREAGTRVGSVGFSGEAVYHAEGLRLRWHGREHHEEGGDGCDWQANETTPLFGTRHNLPPGTTAYGVITRRISLLALAKGNLILDYGVSR